MQMKKVWIVFLVLILMLGMLFFWKGGHHAIVLADALEEWLDADGSSQSLTLMVQKPDIAVDDKGQARPVVEQMSLDAEIFRTEYADRPLYGLTTQGVSAYTDGGNLYMDTGRAYALPDLSGIRSSARELALGLLLHGRLTKDSDTYRLTMKHERMELSASITVDHGIRSVTANAVLPDEMAVTVCMTALPAEEHPIPQPVLDAMVRASMETPMSLTEPLEVLIPALEALLPLTGDLTLGVECGILELSETVTVRMDRETAELERSGVAVSIPMATKPGSIQPLPAALLLLRSGTFLKNGTDASVELTLPAETTAALCAALVPQVESLGMSFGESRAVLTIREERLTAASLTAGGEVPFLVTTIPVAFTAELTVK